MVAPTFTLRQAQGRRPGRGRGEINAAEMVNFWAVARRIWQDFPFDVDFPGSADPPGD